MRIILILLLFVSTAVFADDIPPQYVDLKYCGKPARNSQGDIKRNATAIKYFKLQHPCPETGITSGACIGWSIDHITPLASCGCDTPTNMQWLKNSIKSCAGTECKDRWERIINQYKPEDQ